VTISSLPHLSVVFARGPADRLHGIPPPPHRPPWQPWPAGEISAVRVAAATPAPSRRWSSSSPIGPGTGHRRGRSARAAEGRLSQAGGPAL